MADPNASFVVSARDATAGAINSAAKGLQSLGVTVRNARNILAGFGVVLSARAIGRYVADATDFNKLTTDQIQVIGEAKDAVKVLNAEFQSLVATLAADLAPGFTKAVTAIRNLMTPEGRLVGSLNIDLAEARNRVRELQDEIKSGEPGFFESIFGDRRTIAQLNIELEAANRNLELLEESLRKAKDALSAATSSDSFGKIFLTQDEWVRLESFIYDLNHPKTTNFNGLEQFIDQAKEAAKVTEKFRTKAQQTADELREKQTLFDEGLISPETFSAFKRSLEDDNGELDAFIERVKKAADLVADMRTEREKHADQLKEGRALFDEGLIDEKSFKRFTNSLNDDMMEVGETLGRGLRTSFKDFLTDAEFSFRDFLRDLAAEFVTSAVFKYLATAFGGPTTFLGGVFGGFKAKGGPLDQGKWYVAGEHGPEPVWGGGAGAFAMGYPGAGGGVTINQSFDMRGADSSVLAQFPAMAARLKAETIAAVRDLKNRNRL